MIFWIYCGNLYGFILYFLFLLIGSIITVAVDPEIEIDLIGRFKEIALIFRKMKILRCLKCDLLKSLRGVGLVGGVCGGGLAEGLGLLFDIINRMRYLLVSLFL